MNDLLDAVFELDPAIRYVAIGQGQKVEMRQQAGLADGSTSESDRYEELLVNPALLTLASQRGMIDCGGFHYLILRYGLFFQIVVPLTMGHVSVAVQPEGDPVDIASKLTELLRFTGAYDS